jgi:hypothetical protein
MIQAAMISVLVRRARGIDLHPAYRIDLTRSLRHLFDDLDCLETYTP